MSAEDVLLIMKQEKKGTYEVVKIETLDKASEVLNDEYFDEIYTAPIDLYRRFKKEDLLFLWRQMHTALDTRVIENKFKTASQSHMRCALELWPLLVAKAKPWVEYVTGTGRDAKQKTKAVVYYKCLYVPCEDSTMDVAYSIMAPQCQAIVQILLTWPTGTMIKESNLFVECLKQADRFKFRKGTRHDGWRIFKYYRALLIQKNFLRSL